jgi:endonuclease YncB( thermonuclease family)
VAVVMKSKNQHEKECSLIAKEELSKQILDKIVTLRNIQTEKYGRILADVYIDDLCVNTYMLEKRLAVAYDGGTKNTPSNWMNYYTKKE